MNTAEKDFGKLPDTETAALARESAAELSKFLQEMPAADRARVRMDGHDLILPRQALNLLRDILADMAQGKAVAIMPRHAELTTQQAADMLNVSRPYLIKLLERGELNYHQVGTHRRIRFDDLMNYRQSMKARSAAAMDELTSLAQEHKMGY